MTRLAVLCLLIGVAALAVAIWMGDAMAPEPMRSALAGWLVLISLPLGALPILMALDLMDRGTGPSTGSLRLLLASLPFLALVGAIVFVVTLVAPARLDIGSLYGWSRGGTHGVAAAWFTPRWFCIRGLIYLAIWVLLGLVFMTASDIPSPGRRRLAASGLGLHLVIGTLASFDWTQSLDLGLNSTAFGLLLISLQCAFAMTAALLMTLAAGRARPPRDAILILLVAVAAASFLQFTQYLIVWSANLPREIVWYQHRLAGAGSALFVAAPFILALVFIIMMPSRLNQNRLFVALAGGLLLLFEIANLLWLVTPSWRASFTVSGSDALWLLGLAGMVGAGAILLAGRSWEARHG